MFWQCQFHHSGLWSKLAREGGRYPCSAFDSKIFVRAMANSCSKRAQYLGGLTAHTTLWITSRENPPTTSDQCVILRYMSWGGRVVQWHYFVVAPCTPCPHRRTRCWGSGGWGSLRDSPQPRQFGEVPRCTAMYGGRFAWPSSALPPPSEEDHRYRGGTLQYLYLSPGTAPGGRSLRLRSQLAGLNSLRLAVRCLGATPGHVPCRDRRGSGPRAGARTGAQARGPPPRGTPEIQSGDTEAEVGGGPAAAGPSLVPEPCPAPPTALPPPAPPPVRTSPAAPDSVAKEGKATKRGGCRG